MQLDDVTFGKMVLDQSRPRSRTLSIYNPQAVLSHTEH